MGEETDLLRDAVFDDSEVVPCETGYEAAVCVANAKGRVDEVGFDLNDRYALRERRDGQQEGRAHQK